MRLCTFPGRNVVGMVPVVFQAYLSQLLQKHDGGIPLEKFAARFREAKKKRIKYEVYGYASLTEMLEDLGDVCRVEKAPTMLGASNVMVYPVDELLQNQDRYGMDKRQPTGQAGEQQGLDENAVSKKVTTSGTVLLVHLEGRRFVPTCCLAQLAGYQTDCVVTTLDEDGLEIEGLRHLLVGNPAHEKCRLEIALSCPLACSGPNQIHEVSVFPFVSFPLTKVVFGMTDYHRHSLYYILRNMQLLLLLLQLLLFELFPCERFVFGFRNLPWCLSKAATLYWPPSTPTNLRATLFGN